MEMKETSGTLIIHSFLLRRAEVKIKEVPKRTVLG
jgi:hypothetical protein